MPNKTICSIIAIVIIVCFNMFTIKEEAITYAGMVAISALGGVSIYRNHQAKK